jgi:hypothetical protein
MFRFSIRDVLWLTVVVAVLVAWRVDHSRITAEKQSLILQRDADVANERRLANMRAREIWGGLSSQRITGKPLPVTSRSATTGRP